MPLIFALAAGGSVMLLTMAVFRRRSAVPTVQRRFGDMRDTSKDPLSGSFAERVLGPLFARLGGWITAILPTHVYKTVQSRLAMAGEPITPSRFLATWLAVGVGAPFLVGVMVLASGAAFTSQIALLLGFVVVIAAYVPWVWLRQAADRRAKRIRADLPDAIDLVITNIESGVGLQSAMLMVAHKLEGPVAEEFGRVVRDVSLGRNRSEALTMMTERAGVQEMRLFARAIAQSEQTGIPIARVLRNHSIEMRESRRMRAREQAAKVPVKMTLPTVLLIFPTLFLVILGPVAISLLQRFD